MRNASLAAVAAPFASSPTGSRFARRRNGPTTRKMRVVGLAAAALLLAAPRAAVAAPPANDNFADATAFTSLPFSDLVDVTETTTELGEQQFCVFLPGTVWYAFTPATSGAVRIQATVGGAGNTGISVYTPGGGFGSLSFVSCAVFSGSLAVAVEAGVTYYVQTGSPFIAGLLALTVEAVAPPVNDDFGNATLVGGLPFFDSVDATGATRQPGEPDPSCASGAGASVWYRFTPAATASITATGDFFNRAVAAYTGDTLDGLTEVACRAGFSPTVLIAAAGTTYWFQVSQLGPPGPLSFRLELTPPPVASFFFFPQDPSAFDTVQFQDVSFDPVSAGFLSAAWTFGDGATATGSFVSHRYAADGDYPVAMTATTLDGRTASTSQTIRVRTHDVAVTRLSAPQAASVGQTRSLTVDVRNTRYPEVVEVQLFRSAIGGSQLVGTLRQSVPVRPSTRATPFAFSYTFTAEDAALGKVTFRAVATLVGARDALPFDNEAISTPATKVR
jgi:PKD repeat protein